MTPIDKIFRFNDIRGVYGPEVDEDLAWKAGHAAAQFLRSLVSGYERGQAAANRVVAGRDTRPHSRTLMDALIDGITASSAGCVDIGLADTPMMYFAINHLGTCGGVQITASSEGPEMAGFKIAGAKARPVSRNTGLNEIRHICRTLRRMPVSASMAPVFQTDLWKDYRKHVQKFLKLLRPVRLVVDASNGVAAKTVPAVFGDVDGLEVLPLNFEMEGEPAHGPEPLYESNLAQLSAAVVAWDADFGVCMDADADRCVFVDDRGQAVRSDRMTALLAPAMLEENAGAAIVYDPRCSRVVSEAVRAAGGVPRRDRIGHVAMKKAMTDGHGVFGGDMSGRFYFRDNFNCENPQIALAVAASLVSSSGESMSRLLGPLNRYAHSGEMAFPVADKAAKLAELAKAFSTAEIEQQEGLTCRYEDWWFFARPAPEESALYVTVEAPDRNTLDGRIRAIRKVVG